MDLPLRAQEFPVEVAPGITLVMEPLTDEQYFAINETVSFTGGAKRDQEPESGSEGRGLQMTIRLSRVPGLFEDRFRRAEGFTVAGESLDRKNSVHVAAIPQPWKSLALTRLVRYSMGLSETERGNSMGQAGPSSEATTHSTA